MFEQNFMSTEDGVITSKDKYRGWEGLQNSSNILVYFKFCKVPLHGLLDRDIEY